MHDQNEIDRLAMVAAVVLLYLAVVACRALLFS